MDFDLFIPPPLLVSFGDIALYPCCSDVTFQLFKKLCFKAVLRQKHLIRSILFFKKISCDSWADPFLPPRDIWWQCPPPPRVSLLEWPLKTKEHINNYTNIINPEIMTQRTWMIETVFYKNPRSFLSIISFKLLTRQDKILYCFSRSILNLSLINSCPLPLGAWTF